MSNLVTHEEFEEYKTLSMRQISMPDGSLREVRLTPTIWDLFDCLKVLEGFNEQEIAAYALEELELQKSPELSFDEAYRCCVCFIANQWKP
ncbi:hypothetical protein [Thalassoglobus sp.]|uniref:hypothetical protein n=1 Tax=Thalassoglobus sp. TaxID=2795869 RepID=UPI003AA7B492